MKLWSNSLENDKPIPSDFAFGKYDKDSRIALSKNRNPHLAWGELPDTAKSIVVICHDSDVPSKGDDVNQEGKTVPADLPRVDFYHWVLVDLAVGDNSIMAGEFSDGVTPRGKEGPEGPRGTRQGMNNYTQWFEQDEDMAGEYFGYDGPCPPWNDSIIHHYHFTVFALDVDKVSIEGKFTGPEVLEAIQSNIVDQAQITVTYTINPDAK